MRAGSDGGDKPIHCVSRKWLWLYDLLGIVSITVVFVSVGTPLFRWTGDAMLSLSASGHSATAVLAGVSLMVVGFIGFVLLGINNFRFQARSVEPEGSYRRIARSWIYALLPMAAMMLFMAGLSGFDRLSIQRKRAELNKRAELMAESLRITAPR